jgi:galactose-1-phosphate uridylyltransferase
MKCIEDPSIMTFYSNMEVQSVEIWWANMNEKSVIENGKVKHELKNHRWFKQFSPYNFFRENLVFEVSKEIKLSKVA